jgi:hypothetical protein
MPRIPASEDEMEGLYPSEETPAAEEPTAMTEETPETIDEEEAATGTAVVDNKVLSPGGEPLKEGDKIILEIVKNYGDESEVRYATTSGAPTAAPGGGMAGAEAELDMLSKV